MLGNSFIQVTYYIEILEIKYGGVGLGNSRRGVDLGVDIGPDCWLAERMFNSQRAPEKHTREIQTPFGSYLESLVQLFADGLVSLFLVHLLMVVVRIGFQSN